MTVSLSQPRRPFDGVRLKHLKAFMALASSSNGVEIDRLQRRYGEQAPHFEATFDFLTILGCVRQDGNRVLLWSAELAGDVDGSDFGRAMLQRVLDVRSSCRSEVVDYLGRFRIEEKVAVYYPTTEQRAAESDLRNFLMELDVVTHDATTDSYRINPAHYALFCKVTRTSFEAPLTSTAMSERLEAQDIIGTEAELEIVSFERRRLGAYADRVVHIAPLDQAAGYDIESVTVENGANVVPRLIEVKAVSPVTRRFFWTANEVATAKRFGSWYHLYLLPTGRAGAFDLAGLQIVREPIDAIFGHHSRWTTSPDVFRCECSAGNDDSASVE